MPGGDSGDALAAWAERTGPGWDAIVIGEYERAFYGVRVD
jgi:hypothetical protein